MAKTLFYLFFTFFTPNFFRNDSSNALISSNSILWIAFEMGKIFEFSTYPSSFRFAHDLAYYWSYEDNFGFVGFVSSLLMILVANKLRFGL
jgi:hypothetical protein